MCTHIECFPIFSPGSYTVAFLVGGKFIMTSNSITEKKKQNLFPPQLSKHITIWPGTLIVSHKISSFAQLPEECCEVFGLLPKPCLSKVVSLKPERCLDPKNSSRIFGHPEMVMENYNTDVDTESFFCCPKP